MVALFTNKRFGVLRMTKARPVVMYLEQVRVYGEPISVTRSEVLFAKSDGTTVMPHNRVLTKADNKTMGESFREF